MRLTSPGRRTDSGFCLRVRGWDSKTKPCLIGAPQPYGEIFVMRYDGTQVEQLTDDQWEEGGPAWQPHSSTSMKAAAQ